MMSASSATSSQSVRDVVHLQARKTPRDSSREGRGAVRTERQAASSTSHGGGSRVSSRMSEGRAGATRSPHLNAEELAAHVDGGSKPKGGRQPMLTDLLWKRSNAEGDLLKHSAEERTAARRRRQLRSRRSLPSGVSPVAVACDSTAAIPEPSSSTDSTDRDAHGHCGMPGVVPPEQSPDRRHSCPNPAAANATATLSTDPRSVEGEEQ